VETPAKTWRGARPRPRSATTKSTSRSTSTKPRHIEVQVLADGQGNAIHLGERDCSLQRRHQKVLEEAPAPALNAAEREARSASGCDGAAQPRLPQCRHGIEFLYEDGEFYFIEMNTRLQVEHPSPRRSPASTWCASRSASPPARRFPPAQEDIAFSGHAIECRINAEDPEPSRPRPGR
jgi:acetyl-CoA carboxylase, biotin carboxylase subunit